MAIETRRISISRLLLLVFVPMFMAVSLHTHGGYAAHVDCVDCVNHAPHAGHFSNGNLSFDNCLLCQFSTLPYLMPVVIFTVALAVKGQVLPRSRNSVVCSRATQYNNLRGPPEVILFS
ncbi:MAG: hypothetical protein SOZ80_07030 [Prevotella sp.]|uniref:hypothetical protein n=1 Tax=Prevotella sp. TaxID=59823 RepID=UPI002A2510C8|nr:hypothetical protein [Prevotella sp.]MDD7317647.1 hypothetical protein [Prevotellaceae bacterium]MDY4020506.1 hypothetical protein [Prevotella sp.]